MKNTDALRAQPATKPDRDQAVGEFGSVLREVEQEVVPERLLDLAKQLQSAMSKRRRQMAEEPGNVAASAVPRAAEMPKLQG